MQPKSIILFFYGYILFFRRQKKNKTPITSKGIAKIEILTLVSQTINHELAVFPKFAPKIIPTPATKDISPALKKEREIIETKVEDCMIRVLIAPKSMLLSFVFVE